MSRRLWGALGLLAGLLATLVSPAEAPRAFAGPIRAAGTVAGGTALPRFALLGWVSPPVESTTAARYAEMAGAGFNVAVLSWEDTGLPEGNWRRLAAASGLGLKLLLLDMDLDRIHPEYPSTLTVADSVVERYRDDPAFLGYYVGDEPQESEFERIAQWFDVLRPRDPAHPAWNNLRGRQAFYTRGDFETYVRRYVSVVRPAVLCGDQYDFLATGDAHQLTENIATLSGVARENGLPFWGIVLLVEHKPFRRVSAGMLRWQVAQWMAFGASGIGYFTYWTPAPDPLYEWQPAMIEWGTGERTPYYDMVRDLNRQLAPIGNTLAGTQWLGTMHAGSVPPAGTPFSPGTLLDAVEGRATLGFFADSTTAPLVFVGNADSLAPRDVALTLAMGRRASRLRDDGSGWDSLAADAGGRVTLALDAGGFALLRLTGAVDSLVIGRAPRLAVSPNPARGAVRFDASGMARPARLDVYDVSGRLMWSHAFGSLAGEVTWNGERDGDGRARPGVFLARLSDARGATVHRVVWLGTP
jgi:hypothetical protein